MLVLHCGVAARGLPRKSAASVDAHRSHSPLRPTHVRAGGASRTPPRVAHPVPCLGCHPGGLFERRARPYGSRAVYCAPGRDRPVLCSRYTGPGQHPAVHRVRRRPAGGACACAVRRKHPSPDAPRHLTPCARPRRPAHATPGSTSLGAVQVRRPHRRARCPCVHAHHSPSPVSTLLLTVGPHLFSHPQFVPSAVFGDDTQVDVVVATPAEGDVTAVLVHAAPLGGRLSSGLLGAALSVRASEPR